METITAKTIDMRFAECYIKDAEEIINQMSVLHVTLFRHLEAR